jgi:hypothetical protein
LNGPGTTKWYGGNGNDPNGVTLSDTPVNPSAGGGTQSFSFRTTVGAAVSFKDFTEFRLFDEQSKILIAKAQVPANLQSGSGSEPSKTSSSATAGASSTKTTTTSQSVSVNKNSASSASSTIAMSILFILWAF